MKKIILLITMIILVSFLSAATWYVNPDGTEDFTTIQAAVNASSNNDIIIVRDGTYNESLEIDVSGLELRSDNGPEVCFISDSIQCIEITVSSIKISGFTIENGSQYGIYGGGSILEISNCIFKDNGCAILAFEELYDLNNCIFKDNSGYSVHSSAVYYYQDYPLGINPTVHQDITNCLFIDNDVTGYDIYLVNASNNHSGTIENCTFLDADGIGCGAEDVTVQDCIFDNTSTINGVDLISYCAFTGSDIYSNDANCLFNTDPLFTDGVPYLKINSPCRSTGCGGDDMGWCSYADGSETKEFHDKWSWVSFPRMPRLYDEEYDAETVVEDLEPDALQVLHEGFDMTWNSIPPPGQWDPSATLTDFQSSLGYKVNMNYNSEPYELLCYGGIANPDLPVTLEAGVESWVGYFHTNNATPEVAFEDVWSEIKSIKHENWAKWRKYQGGSWYGYTNVPWVGFHYGEMAVVEIFGLSDQEFKWHSSFGSRSDDAPPESSFFSYETKSDYIPIQIDLSDDDPAEEVGAFAGAECVGFGKVVDGRAVILAYIIDDIRSGDLEFVLYNGERSPLAKVNDYYVLNYRTEEYENARIHLESLQSDYVISLRQEENTIPSADHLKISNYPNPFNPSTTINYNVTQTTSFVTLGIYNAKGQLVKSLVNGEQPEGNYNVSWNGKDESGNGVASGIYYYKITVGTESLMKKMVLLK